MRTAETLQTYHTYVHILRNTSCIRKPQVIWGGGGGVCKMPCRGSCLKFRPRAQEYRQDFRNRKSVAAKKKKKRRIAGKKDAVSVSGFQKNPRLCGKHFADRNVAGKPVSCGWLYLPITRCTVIVVHWLSLPHSLTSCQRNAWLWLFTSCLCHIPLPL